MQNHALRLAAIESTLAFAYAFAAAQPEPEQDAAIVEAIGTLRALGITDREMVRADQLGGFAAHLGLKAVA